MKLEEYRIKYGVSYAHIAHQCNYSAAMISQIATGRHSPSFELALLIEKATHGMVPRDNWFPPRAAPVTITIGQVTI